VQFSSCFDTGPVGRFGPPALQHRVGVLTRAGNGLVVLILAILTFDRPVSRSLKRKKEKNKNETPESWNDAEQR